MKKTPTLISIIFFSMIFFWTTGFVSAQPDVRGVVGSNDPTKSKSFQLVSCNPTFDPNNPEVLKNDCNYKQLVATAYRFIVYVFYIIIPIMAGMLMFAGFKYMTAGGDAKIVEDAKKMFKPILIGLFLIFGAWLIVNTILDKLLAESIGDITKSSIIGK